MTGIRNLSQMIINKKLGIVLIIALLVYLLPELLFENTMLYIVGGVVGGTLQEGFKLLGGKPSDYLVFSVWVVLLIGIVFLYYRLQNKLLQYTLIIVIAAMLYVVDFFIFEMLPDNATDYYLISGIRILSKSLLLSVIIYYGLYRRNKETKTVE